LSPPIKFGSTSKVLLRYPLSNLAKVGDEFFSLLRYPLSLNCHYSSNLDDYKSLDKRLVVDECMKGIITEVLEYLWIRCVLQELTLRILSNKQD
jgi:hypothetical protein